MEFLGTVSGVTSEGHLIVPCQGLPDIGAAVFDDRRRRTGTVRRILGPVDAPYASVTAENGNAPAAGAKLYFEGKGHDGKAKRRNRRD